MKSFTSASGKNDRANIAAIEHCTILERKQALHVDKSLTNGIVASNKGGGGIDIRCAEVRAFQVSQREATSDAFS